MKSEFFFYKFWSRRNIANIDDFLLILQIFKLLDLRARTKGKKWKKKKVKRKHVLGGWWPKISKDATIFFFSMQTIRPISELTFLKWNLSRTNNREKFSFLTDRMWFLKILKNLSFRWGKLLNRDPMNVRTEERKKSLKMTNREPKKNIIVTFFLRSVVLIAQKVNLFLTNDE